MTIGVDSGAGVSVWPTGLCNDYPTYATEASRRGTSYRSAGSGTKPILNQGERKVQLVVDKELAGVRVQVAGVRKPLLSVADMNDVGHGVFFLANGEAYSVHRDTGRVTHFARRKGVFEIDAEVPPYSGGSGQPLEA